MVGEALHPETTFNPVLQRFHQCLHARALEPGCPLPALDPVIDSYVKPDSRLFASAAKATAALRAAFPLQKVVKKKTKKRHWGMGADEGVVAGLEFAGGEPPLKKARMDGHDGEHKEELSVDSLFAAKAVRAVGPVNPVQDFNAMLKNREEDLVETAVQGMIVQIKRQIEEGGSMYYGKALTCLQELRNGCNLNYEAASFNTYLSSAKAAYETGTHAAFWALVVDRGITLISTDENDGSEVSPEAAAEFLKAAAQAAPAAAAADDEDDDDDLFDDMD
eukprot:PLAT143.8.p2 GENE.PLAT143.8~~PLAT143.8.p2  ORF type:complete len:320 (-),score=154.07 PLAT143.8:1198-2028(-)